MAGIMDADLVIAAAQGGALGSLPCAMLSVEKAREAGQHHPPTGIGTGQHELFCHTPGRCRRKTRGRMEASGLRLITRSSGSIQRRPSTPPTARRSTPRCCGLVEELKPEVVSFHFVLPEQALLERVKAAGCIVMSSATIVKEAIWLEENGADVIIAQGAEAGGHRGMFLTENIAEQPGNLRAGAAGRRCREGPGDCRRWHRRWAGHRGGVRAGRGRGADRHRLSALPGIQGQCACAVALAQAAGRCHRDHQCDDRPPGARGRQPCDA